MNDSTFHFVVIDDDNVSNAVCTSVIKATTGGLNPVCFTNPVEGLHYMEHAFLAEAGNTPTILFLDLSMPEMNGWDWLFKFEQLPHSIKQHVSVYILTSSISSKDAERAQSNVYVKGYILKPLNKSRVLGALEALHVNVLKEAS
ncbi:MAG TPA: response regulator [Bacteroidia bacterium]|nr:response regulator [Bacteroidia bacterium]